MTETNNIFDDLDDAPEREAVPRTEQVRALREVVRVAQAQRLPPVAVVVEPAGTTTVLGELEDGSESARGEGAFTPTVTKLPLLQRLFRKFASSAPRPRIVRVDTEKSYEAWKNTRREPYRVALERAIAERDAQDGLDAENHSKQILAAEQRFAECGEKVPLSLPPHAEGKIDCWQDGEEIFASVHVRGPDGKPRIVTSSTTTQQHVEQVVGYASDANIDPFAAVGVMPVLAQILGGGQLVAQICRAAPVMVARPEVAAGDVFVGVVRPVSSPAIAAAMALLLRARSGDGAANDELALVLTSPRGKKLFDEASRRLAEAQHKERG